MSSNDFAGPNITIGSYSDCHDANNNGIPDDLEMANFGCAGLWNRRLRLGRRGQLPRMAQRHRPEQNPVSPGFTNLYVNTNTAYGTIQVLDGVPSQMAVLVNSTNWAAATVVDYNLTVPIPLGTTDGVCRVWVGLRGRSTHFWLAPGSTGN